MFFLFWLVTYLTIRRVKKLLSLYVKYFGKDVSIFFTKRTIQHSTRFFILPLLFIKRLILVQVDMPRNDFKLCWIFTKLFIFELSKTGSTMSNTAGRYNFQHFDNFPGASALNAWLIFLLYFPIKGRESPSKFFKMTPHCHQGFSIIKAPGSSDSPH